MFLICLSQDQKLWHNYNGGVSALVDDDDAMVEDDDSVGVGVIWQCCDTSGTVGALICGIADVEAIGGLGLVEDIPTTRAVSEEVLGKSMCKPLVGAEQA